MAPQGDSVPRPPTTTLLRPAKAGFFSLYLEFEPNSRTNEAGQVAGRTKKHTGGATIFTETFTHDLDGNLTGRERNDGTSISSITYEWNDFDRLIAVSSALNGTPTADVKQESLYGVNGFRRKKKDKNGNVTLEYADGLATAVAKSVSVTTYIQAHGIVGFERDGDFYYFLTDALGSVRDIVRGTDGAVLQSYDYTENGEKTASTSFESDKTWVGGLSVNDDTTDSGLYLMGHRHYDHSLGRFLSRDPIGFQGGLNLYSMAANSPVTFTDHTGLEPGAWTGEKHAVFVGDYASDPSSWVIQNGPMEPGRQPLRSSSEGGSLPSLYDKRNIRFLADYLGVDESTILMSGMMLGAISFGLGGRGQPCLGQVQGPTFKMSPATRSHIFRNSPGHMNHPTPGNIRAIQALAQDPAAVILEKISTVTRGAQEY